MRLTALALVALLAACGGDEPEETQTPPPRPAPSGPAADTTLGDTAMPGISAATARRQAQEARGQGQQPDAAGAAGEAGGQGQTAGGGQAAAGQAGGGAGAAGAGAASGQRLYTVQVAAFTEATTATEWEGRLRRQGLPVWTSMAEVGGQTFYRLRVGAVPTFAEARTLGTLIGNRYEWPVWVAPVAPADRVPQDAVQRTRQTLRGG